MLIQLFRNGLNHRCCIFDPSDPGGKDNKCSVWREGHHVVSPGRHRSILNNGDER